MRRKRVNYKKSILIIDGHPLFRKGLKAIIARAAKFEVVGDAGNGREGLRMAKELVPERKVMFMQNPNIGIRTLITSHTY